MLHFDTLIQTIQEKFLSLFDLWYEYALHFILDVQHVNQNRSYPGTLKQTRRCCVLVSFWQNCFELRKMLDFKIPEKVKEKENSSDMP